MRKFDYNNNFLERLLKVHTLLKVQQFVIPHYYLFILQLNISHSIISIIHIKTMIFD